MADDLEGLARSFGELPKHAAPFVRKAVEVSARNVKDEIRAEYSGSQNLPGASRSVSYDMKGGNGIRAAAIEAEIGPELGGQGSIVGVVDNGTTRTPGKRRIPKAGENEVEGFQRGLDKAIDDALREAGL